MIVGFTMTEITKFKKHVSENQLLRKQEPTENLGFLKRTLLVGSVVLISSFASFSQVPTDVKPPEALKNRIKLEEQDKHRKSNGKYALIVIGELEERFIISATIAYDTLVENGFNPKNIYVLSDYGDKRSSYPVDGSANKETMKLVLDHLSKTMNKKSRFVLYMHDHGELKPFKVDGSDDRYENLPAFRLGYKFIGVSELQTMVSNIEAKREIFVFDFCLDGSFAEALGKGNVVALSSDPDNKLSHSDFLHSFSGYFFDAFRKGYRPNKKRISVEDAYNFSKSHDGHNRPRIFGDIDPNKVTLK